MWVLRRLLQLLIAFGLLFSSASHAIENATISIGTWSSAALDAQNLQSAFTLLPNGIALTLTAESLELPAPVGRISAFSLVCPSVVMQSEKISCKAGRLAFSHPLLGQQTLRFELSAEPDIEQFRLSLFDITLGDGQLQLKAQFDAKVWQLEATGQAMQLGTAISLLADILRVSPPALLDNYQPDARTEIQLKASGRAAQPESVALDVQFSQLNFSDAAGLAVAEAIDGELTLVADYQQQWQWQQQLSITAGQTYVDPIFVDFETAPLTLSSEGQWDSTTNQIAVNQFALQHQSHLAAQGQFELSDWQPQTAAVAFQTEQLDTTYQTWLKPFFVGAALGDLTLNGKLQGNLALQAENYQFAVELNDVDVIDKQQRFAIVGLNGNAGWGNTSEQMPVEINWQSLAIGPIPIGAATITASVEERQFVLLQPLRLPLFDGALLINAFNLLSAEDATRWEFDGLLTPVSMSSISAALGWPILEGKLSGIIPSVRYLNEQIKVDGALQVGVFGGTAIVRDLLLVSPFGSLPQLQANIDMQQLDLALITQTFDFGKITGNIDGFIHDLRLSNWQLVQFNASFFTSAEPGRRRISQRAVDNLTQVGGGVGGLLSRGFMGFFEDFSYSKMGLSCRLMNEICQMSGVEDAEQGYYIVKGGGLPPWINVIGFTRRVDWPDLLARLQAVKDSEGPIIE